MRLRIVLLLAVCLGLIAYFGYHVMNGDNGLLARVPIQQQVIMLEGELAGLRAVREKLDRDVALLRGEHLDPDMLDERARAILNLAHPNDLVIVNPRSATGSTR